MAVVKPYHLCASRLEQRGSDPLTREHADELLEAVDLTGVEAIIHSGVSQPCMPLFPSKVFPTSHANASFDGFHYFIEAMHSRGKPVLSWYSLNHSVSVSTAHPDWRLVPFYDVDMPLATDDHTYLCINGPYGELLPDFMVELIRDVHFDGVWFDGNTFAMVGNAHPGCRCEACHRKFRDDTGDALPTHEDFASPVFRRWIQWRYECMIATWRRLQKAITSTNPAATMALNNYRRWSGLGWQRGIPMRKLNLDALMSGENDLHALHGDFQMKMHRAYNCHRGQDTWLALCDHWNMWTPDVQTVPVEQAAIAAVGGGGVMWMGSGYDARLSPAAPKAAQDTTAPLMPFVQGDFVEHVAIWAGEHTQDYGHIRAYPPQGVHPAWEDWHGANELCLHAHVQSSVIFDDHVTDGDIVGRYPVLLAGNTICVSDAQAANLRRYVEAGGLLIACHDFATRDEWGQPRDRPILDDLLGITSRAQAANTPVLELLDTRLRGEVGGWASIVLPGHTLATTTADVTLLSHVVDHAMGSWDQLDKAGNKPARHTGLWHRSVGKGGVIYCGANLARGHCIAPTVFHVKLFRALLDRYAPPAVTLDAPLQVTMNTRLQSDGSWAVLLHNAPGTIWRYSTRNFNSAELVPVHDIAIRVRDRQVTAARSALTGETFAITDEGSRIAVPKLPRNDVVLLSFA